MLTLTFSKMVTFNSVTFGEIDEDDDADIFIDGQIFMEDVAFGGLGQNPVVFLPGVMGTSISFGADTVLSGLGGGDDFRVLAIDVTPVPVPAALPLLAAGLGALFVAGRRKRAA